MIRKSGLLNFVQGLSVKYTFYVAFFFLLLSLRVETRAHIKSFIYEFTLEKGFLNFNYNGGLIYAMTDIFLDAMITLCVAYIIRHIWIRDNLVFESDMLRIVIVSSNLIIMIACMEYVLYEAVLSVTLDWLLLVGAIFLFEVKQFLWGKSF